MTTLRTDTPDVQVPTLRRAGYAIAIVVNVVMLYVANNLLAWDLLPFLTDDFDRVLPLINLSLAASIAANVAFIVYDRAWWKSACQIALAGIAMAVAIRFYRVFPFDFSAYEFNWSALARFVIVLTMVGLAAGIVAEAAKLTTAVVKGSTRPG